MKRLANDILFCIHSSSRLSIILTVSDTTTASWRFVVVVVVVKYLSTRYNTAVYGTIVSAAFSSVSPHQKENSQSKYL